MPIKEKNINFTTFFCLRHISLNKTSEINLILVFDIIASCQQRWAFFLKLAKRSAMKRKEFFKLTKRRESSVKCFLNHVKRIATSAMSFLNHVKRAKGAAKQLNVLRCSGLR